MGPNGVAIFSLDHSPRARVPAFLARGPRRRVPGAAQTLPRIIPHAFPRHSPGTHGEPHLARDDLIQATGSVDKILGGGRYQITLETGQVVTAQLSGRMRRFRIRVIPGDRVTVGLSPYDPTHGFITFRLREGQNAP